MASISIGKAWQESVAFVAREGALLVPVALLFVALPGLIVQEMMPPELTNWAMAEGREGLPNVPGSFWLAMLIAVVVIWFGSLTLFALALRPGISVGEALRLGLARLPVLLGTALLLLGVIVAAVAILAIVVGLLATASKAAGAMAGLVLGTALAFAGIFASIRLLLLNPVVIDGTLGVTGSIRHAWALGRGHFWRLFGFVVIMVVLSSIISGAAQTVFGTIAGLIASAEVAKLVGGIAAALVSAIIQIYLLVMIARFYRQAEPKDMATIFG